MDDVLLGLFGGCLRFPQLKQPRNTPERDPRSRDGIAEECGSRAPDEGGEDAFGGPYECREGEDAEVEVCDHDLSPGVAHGFGERCRGVGEQRPAQVGDEGGGCGLGDRCITAAECAVAGAPRCCEARWARVRHCPLTGSNGVAKVAGMDTRYTDAVKPAGLTDVRSISCYELKKF